MAQIRGKALSGHSRERRTSILAWMRLTRVFAKMQRAAAVQLRHWELSVAHFDVLVQTGLAEGLSQRELAERLLISKGNLSQLLDKMERDDLLARCREGRVNCLRLTTLRRGPACAPGDGRGHLRAALGPDPPQGSANIDRYGHVLPGGVLPTHAAELGHPDGRGRVGNLRADPELTPIVRAPRP